MLESCGEGFAIFFGSCLRIYVQLVAHAIRAVTVESWDVTRFFLIHLTVQFVAQVSVLLVCRKILK